MKSSKLKAQSSRKAPGMKSSKLKAQSSRKAPGMKSSKLKAQSSRKAPGGNGQASKGHLPGASVWKDLGRPSPLLLHENSPPSPAQHARASGKAWSASEDSLVRSPNRLPLTPPDTARCDNW